MNLLSPRVKGPLSVCSSTVRVEGQLTGSRVDIFADGIRAGGGVASWSDQSFPLDSGITLIAGAHITATQTLGADTSPASSQDVTVQARPPVIGNVGFVSHLYVCGQCVWLDGMVPGARVEVKVGTVLRGSGSAPDGIARIGLTAPTALGDVLVAQQIACGTAGLLSPGPRPDSLPVGHGQKLTPPTVESPLKACQTAVTVSNVFEGTQVTLSRTVGPTMNSCFDRASLWFQVPPLVEGESVKARQAFIACEVRSDDSNPVIVDPTKPVPVPIVVPPLCDGSTSVRISGLLAGSKVRILQGGIELGIGEAPDSSFDFLVPALSGGSLVAAQQELCNIWSDRSNEVLVDPAPASLPQPVIPGPLFECGSVVLVANTQPGLRVYVISSNLGAPIGEEQAYAKEVNVSVAPQLIAGDRIYAIQIGCSLTSSKSDLVPVQNIGDVNAPSIRPPLDECMTAVPVVGVVPGARVDVYVNNVWRGTMDAGEPSVDVPISGHLQVGDSVTARQRICAIVTKFSMPSIVVRSPGKWTVLNNSSEVLAVHAALLHNGKILYFSGDEHDKGQHDRNQLDHTRLFDCNNLQVSRIESPTTDVFCSGHAFLADGRLVVAGGTEAFPGEVGGVHAPHFPGLHNTWIYDPFVTTTPWIEAALMNFEPGQNNGGGRWYPTLITIRSGEILAMCGHPSSSDMRHNNTTPEKFSPFPMSLGSWMIMGSIGDPGMQPYYPRLHVLPGGDVFCSTPLDIRRKTTRYNPVSGLLTDICDCPTDAIYDGFATTSVMLPLLPNENYRARILICGGQQPMIIDMTVPNPTWQPTSPRTLGGQPIRNNLNAVILPTGEIFILGGVSNDSVDSSAVFEAELYRPDTNSWQTLPSASVIRNYHSVGLLMPDGRVWTCGSNKDGRQSFPDPGIDNRELRIEIFEPWYYCANRPQITSFPSVISFDQQFEVHTTQATAIRRVTVIHPGSVTHAFNTGQRYIGLNFNHNAGDVLLVNAPPDSVTVPGYYLLFVINDQGVPSEGKFVRISPH